MASVFVIIRVTRFYHAVAAAAMLSYGKFRGGLDRSQLPIHLHKIKVVPSLDDFSAFDSRNRDASEFDGRLSRGKSQTVAGVLTANAATRGDEIALGKLIFDDDFDIGKRFPKLRMKWLEARWATQRVQRIVGQSVSYPFISEHFRNGFSSAFVPDLFEPTTH